MHTHSRPGISFVDHPCFIRPELCHPIPIGARILGRLGPIENGRGSTRMQWQENLFRRNIEGRPAIPRTHMSDYDDSSLRRSTQSRRARVATIGFRARKLFLFIAPFSAGRLRLNHCASPYWMGRTRCMVYSRRHSRSAGSSYARASSFFTDSRE